MSDNTHIEWTDATWNPITGCSVVSPGCTNCYAMRLAGTRLKDHPSRKGLTADSKAGPVWNGEVRFNRGWLQEPLRWQKPRRIFVCAHGDLFHESVPDEWVDFVFAVMFLRERHTFQVLTKRIERARAYLSDPARPVTIAWAAGHLLSAMRGEANVVIDIDVVRVRERWPLANVHLGVSVEDQERADDRIPTLLDTPAALRWISAEPLLGPVVLGHWTHPVGRGIREAGGKAFVPYAVPNSVRPGLDWVVVGGESGPGGRPMHPDWARQIRDDCAAAGVPFFFKQWGDWNGVEDLRQLPGGQGPGFGKFDSCRHDTESDTVRIGKRAAGRTLDGVTHDAMPQRVSTPDGDSRDAAQSPTERPHAEA